MADSTLPESQALDLSGLITLTEGGIASRVLAKRSGGNITLFAFDAGQGLTEHTSPFDAFVVVLEGVFGLTIGSAHVEARQGQIVRLPAAVSHSVEAREPSRMLLVMLRDGGATA
jgi:quercetin dioxygenase-like cupin family protein